MHCGFSYFCIASASKKGGPHAGGTTNLKYANNGKWGVQPPPQTDRSTIKKGATDLDRFAPFFIIMLLSLM